MDSLVVACGLGCSLRCGILVPRPEMELTSPAVTRESVNHWTTRVVRLIYFPNEDLLVILE